MNPITTIGPLHFADLNDKRFEDLCVQLIYTMRNWINFQHHGRKGKDRGVDIQGEFIDDMDDHAYTRKTCVIQCKKYKDISKSELCKILDDFLENKNAVPDVYLLMVACDVSRDSYEEFQKYAKQKGFLSVDIWTAANLEAELYARRPDLLYVFFGVKIFSQRLATVARIQRRISMKKKVYAQLISEKGKAKKNGSEVLEVIIHDVHRDMYPDSNFSSSGISPWFKLEFVKSYYGGLSFYLSIENILINKETGKWKLWDYESEISSEYLKIKAFRVGNIPYDNIVDIDIEGDEYYMFPHIYCEFNHLGSPYERIWYKVTPQDQALVSALCPEDVES